MKYNVFSVKFFIRQLADRFTFADSRKYRLVIK